MRNNFLLSFILTILTIRGFSQITITEVMHRPISNNNRDQFIELECSDSSGFSLLNFRLIIAGVDHFLIPVSGNPQISYGYAIIHPSDYSVTSGRYENDIPLNTPRFKINEAFFCGNGIPLSDTISVQLVSPDLQVVSIFPIRSFQRIGYSLERICTRIATNDSNWNWSRTIDGTPGRRNSVSPPLFDFEVSTIEYSPLPLRNSLPYGRIKIQNRGELSQSFNIEVLFKRNPNIPFQFYTNAFVHQITPFQNSLFTFPISQVDTLQGKLYLKARLNLNDENLSNNEFSQEFHIWNSVVPTITEIMLTPFSGQPKWIEFYWGSPNRANLGDWKIVIQNEQITIPFHNVSIAPNVRFVVSTGLRPSNVNLPPEQLIIIPDFHLTSLTYFRYQLISSWGEVIEEMNYRAPSFPMLVQGKSLVRKSLSHLIDEPTNWFVSRDRNGSAPGTIDAQPDTFGFIHPPIQYNEYAKLITKKFSPFGLGGLPLFAEVEVTTEGNDYEQIIYDLSGKVRRKLSFRLSNGIHIIQWDGLDNQGKIVDCGVYLFILKSNNQIVFREPIIVAR